MYKFWHIDDWFEPVPHAFVPICLSSDFWGSDEGFGTHVVEYGYASAETIATMPSSAT